MARGVDGTTVNVSNKGDTDKKIAKLEMLLAIEIQRAAELLKENQALTKELDKVKRERNALGQYYQKSQRENKIRCDRDKAMVVYGEIDMNELKDRRVDNN